MDHELGGKRLSEIAVCTTQGRAYYMLVTELKRRGIPFLNLTPFDPIPPTIKAVITTPQEKVQIRFSRVIIYNVDEDPASAIDQALQPTGGKTEYERLVVGLDPGKTVGLAIVGDGNLIESSTSSSPEEAANAVMKALEEFKAKTKVVKVGDGVREYQRRLLSLLDHMLPPDVRLESVAERGTTRDIGLSPRRGRLSRDARSAIRISMRSGVEVERRRRKYA